MAKKTTTKTKTKSKSTKPKVKKTSSTKKRSIKLKPKAKSIVYQPNKKLTKEEKLVANDFRRRVNIKEGLHVKIEESRFLPNLTEGYVKDILTDVPYHDYGIKVKLKSGQEGRVKEILDKIDKR